MKGTYIFTIPFEESKCSEETKCASKRFLFENIINLDYKW